MSTIEVSKRADFKGVRSKAQEVLKENLIYSPPIDAYEIARNYGVNVMNKPFPDKIKDIAGFIIFNEHKIYVNAADSLHRRRFTVAHELGHLLLHEKFLEQNPELGVLARRPLGRKDDDPLEQEANCFAANLLVPGSMLERYKNENPNLVAEIFGVSPDVIGYRMKNLNMENHEW
jgi:Zn-dependent peptidase ImmA (M78 family)